MINWRREGQPVTQTGGVLFSTKARAVAARGDWHLWVNTYSILNKAGGYLSGGRGDRLAVLADVPEEAFGFWVERGATIIQTDEPTRGDRMALRKRLPDPLRPDQLRAAGNLPLQPPLPSRESADY